MVIGCSGRYRRKTIINSALVTGASGFIGKKLIRGLEKSGAKISALVRNKNNLKASRGINIFVGDIFDIEILKKAVYNVDVVFHLVAKTHDFYITNNSLKDYSSINIEGTRNILNACVDSKIKHFVYFSSVKAMAEESNDTLDESSTPHPTTSYGKTKLAAESLVAEYGEKYGFMVTSIRLPLVYGPGNKGNIYKMIDAIVRRRFVMIGRGESIRSMVYVGNVIDAALKIVCCEEANGKIYIVADGNDYTVKELYETISKGLNKRLLPFYIPMKIAKRLALLGDIGGRIIRRPLPLNSETLNKLTTSLRCSSRKIQQEIGFKPRYNLYNTIDETVKWYMENR